MAMYVDNLIVRNRDKIMESLQPGGIVVIEGFHRDLNEKSDDGSYLGFSTNQLLQMFNRLRILHYEDVVDNTLWWRGQKAPIVRLMARKEVLP